MESADYPDMHYANAIGNTTESNKKVMGARRENGYVYAWLTVVSTHKTNVYQ